MLKAEQINYTVVGSGDINIILLNGKSQFESLFSEISIGKFKITIVELKEMNYEREAFIDKNINKYTRILKEFIDKSGLKKPIIIAHSFAYEIALNYTFMNQEAKVIKDGRQEKQLQRVKKWK